MKKFLSILLFLFIALPASAKEIKSVYVIKNVSKEQIFKEIKQQLNNLAPKEADDILYSNENNYYFKNYKNSENVEIFVYTKNSDVLSIMEKLSKKAYKLEDKATFEKYNSDFLSFASSNNFGNIKSKKKNKKGYNKYNPYTGKLRNEVLEVKEIAQNDIKIERKKLKPKVKVKYYAYAWEYTVSNNTSNDIIIKNVASEEFMGLTQIAAYTLIPRGLDFVPIYDAVYSIQSDLEKNKFTRPHPTNETIKKGETMRILALSKMKDTPVADFTFIVDDREVLIKF